MSVDGGGFGLNLGSDVISINLQSHRLPFGQTGMPFVVPIDLITSGRTADKGTGRATVGGSGGRIENRRKSHHNIDARITNGRNDLAGRLGGTGGSEQYDSSSFTDKLGAVNNRNVATDAGHLIGTGGARKHHSATSARRSSTAASQRDFTLPSGSDTVTAVKSSGKAAGNGGNGGNGGKSGHGTDNRRKSHLRSSISDIDARTTNGRNDLAGRFGRTEGAGRFDSDSFIAGNLIGAGGTRKHYGESNWRSSTAALEKARDHVGSFPSITSTRPINTASSSLDLTGRHVAADQAGNHVGGHGSRIHHDTRMSTGTQRSSAAALEEGRHVTSRISSGTSSRRSSADFTSTGSGLSTDTISYPGQNILDSFHGLMNHGLSNLHNIATSANSRFSTMGRTSSGTNEVGLAEEVSSGKRAMGGAQETGSKFDSDGHRLNIVISGRGLTFH